MARPFVRLTRGARRWRGVQGGTWRGDDRPLLGGPPRDRAGRRRRAAWGGGRGGRAGAARRRRRAVEVGWTAGRRRARTGAFAFAAAPHAAKAAASDAPLLEGGTRDTRARSHPFWVSFRPISRRDVVRGGAPRARRGAGVRCGAPMFGLRLERLGRGQGSRSTRSPKKAFSKESSRSNESQANDKPEPNVLKLILSFFGSTHHKRKSNVINAVECNLGHSRVTMMRFVCMKTMRSLRWKEFDTIDCRSRRPRRQRQRPLIF